MKIEGRNIYEATVNTNNVIFLEDEVNYPGKVTINQKYFQITGKEFNGKDALCTLDMGDMFIYIMPTKLIVKTSFDGGSIFAPAGYKGYLP